MARTERGKDSGEGKKESQIRDKIRENKGKQEPVDFSAPKILDIEQLEKKDKKEKIIQELKKEVDKEKEGMLDDVKKAVADKKPIKYSEEFFIECGPVGVVFDAKKVSDENLEKLASTLDIEKKDAAKLVEYTASANSELKIELEKNMKPAKQEPNRTVEKIPEKDFVKKLKNLHLKFGTELLDKNNNKLIVKSFNKTGEITIIKTIDGKENNPEIISLGELEKLLDIYKQRRSSTIKKDIPPLAPKIAENKEKTPSMPEIMEAKLDELKKMLLSKKAELKKYKGKKGVGDKTAGLKKEIKEINGEIEETGKYFDVSREASKKIIGKIRNQSRDVNGNLVHGYEDINAQTREEGDEKFLKKARQLWTDFVTHGTIVWDDNKKEYILDAKGGDLDSKSCEALLEKAGLSLNYLERVASGESVKGKTMLDTSNVEGVVYDEEDGSLYIDHHGKNSPRNVSTTARTYELLVKMGLLKEDETIEKVIKYINESDNAIDVDVDNYYKNSWRTIRGLSRFIKFNELYDFFRSNNPDPERELSDGELAKYGLKDRSKEQYNRAINLHKELENLNEEGLILDLDSDKYGKVVIDIGGKTKKDFEAVRAYDANTYIVWNPERGEFWMTSENEITDKFPQGKNMRKTMWITQKKVGKPEPMKMTLEEVLQIMAGKEKLEEILKEKNDDGKLAHEKLIDFFEQEIENRKTSKIEEEEAEEKKKEEDIENGKGFAGKLNFAEKDFLEAKENYQVARMSRTIRAHGVSLYEDLLPGDDYSIRIKAAREEYEERKAELEKFREIAKDPEKIKQFEKEEKEKSETKIRRSELEERLEEADIELRKSREDYMEMSHNKKEMWDKVNSFLRREKREEKDEDVEYYGKKYEKALSEFKKLIANYLEDSGFKGEKLRKALQLDREFIALREEVKFYTGNADARLRRNAKNNNSWELIRKEGWFSKLPGKFKDLLVRIRDGYFNPPEAEGENAQERREKERKTIDEISPETRPREVAGDIMFKISSGNRQVWSDIRNSIASEEMKKNRNVGKRTRELIDNCKKVFGDEAEPKDAEKMKEYVQRITRIIIRKKESF